MRESMRISCWMCVWLISAVDQRRLFFVMLPCLLSCGTVSSHLYSIHTHAHSHKGVVEVITCPLVLCTLHVHALRLVKTPTFIPYLESYPLIQTYFHEHTFNCAHTHTHSQALSSSTLPLTLSLWPWAGIASGCCWDFCAGGWRADGESLGQGSHNFHPSIHPFVWLMNERKVFPPPLTDGCGVLGDSWGLHL